MIRVIDKENKRELTNNEIAFLKNELGKRFRKGVGEMIQKSDIKRNKRRFYCPSTR